MFFAALQTRVRSSDEGCFAVVGSLISVVLVTADTRGVTV